MAKSRVIISTNKAPPAIGTYSQGVEYANLIFFSGLIGVDPKTSLLKEKFNEQLQQIMLNLKNLLTSLSLNEEHVLKTTVFLTDLNDFEAVNLAYKDFFKDPYPARSCVEVSKLPKDSLVEIEVIAKKDV